MPLVPLWSAILIIYTYGSNSRNLLFQGGSWISITPFSSLRGLPHHGNTAVGSMSGGWGHRGSALCGSCYCTYHSFTSVWRAVVQVMFKCERSLWSHCLVGPLWATETWRTTWRWPINFVEMNGTLYLHTHIYIIPFLPVNPLKWKHTGSFKKFSTCSGLTWPTIKTA